MKRKVGHSLECPTELTLKGCTYFYMRSPAHVSDEVYWISGSTDGTTRIWDVTSGKELRRYIDETVSHVLFSPDGEDVLIDNTVDFAVWPVDLNTHVDDLCQKITRDFTEEERLLYEIDTQSAPCPGLVE